MSNGTTDETQSGSPEPTQPEDPSGTPAEAEEEVEEELEEEPAE